LENDLTPSSYGRFLSDNLWPLLGDHRGLRDALRHQAFDLSAGNLSTESDFVTSDFARVGDPNLNEAMFQNFYKSDVVPFDLPLCDLGLPSIIDGLAGQLCTVRVELVRVVLNSHPRVELRRPFAIEVSGKGSSAGERKHEHRNNDLPEHFLSSPSERAVKVRDSSFCVAVQNQIALAYS
jgi:hypothetical protein